jgi:endonuclease YncB( thermonuclease family)
MFLTLNSWVRPHRSNAMMLAGAAFAAGLLGGLVLAPRVSGTITVTGAVAAQPVPNAFPDRAQTMLRSGHALEVLRVIDGDTFEARVHVWPGMAITTKVRLRGIDAAEMRARCEDERLQAIAARDALSRLLAEGAVGVWHVGQDKYGGRVDADVSTARTPDVAASLLEAGLVRRYSGGRRQSWCND